MIRKLSQKDLRHGELQVKRMLKDRPVMAKYITKNDIIWQWAVRKFAGEDLSDTIDWDNKNPYQRAPSVMLHPCKSERGRIRIRKGLSFEVSWANAIYQLYSIAFSSSFKEAVKRAYKGSLSKQNFILRCAGIAFKSVKRTERFYKDIWENLKIGLNPLIRIVITHGRTMEIFTIII